MSTIDAAQTAFFHDAMPFTKILGIEVVIRRGVTGLVGEIAVAVRPGGVPGTVGTGTVGTGPSSVAT